MESALKIAQYVPHLTSLSAMVTAALTAAAIWSAVILSRLKIAKMQVNVLNFVCVLRKKL